jgi:hypothetical protein
MLKFIVVNIAMLLTSFSIASARSTEGSIDVAGNGKDLSDGPKIQLAYGARSTAIYNSHTYITDPNGGPAKVLPKYRVQRRPK